MDSKINIEKEYFDFFETLKNLSGMEEIINWQENSEFENAKDFFDNINVLPNMPPLTSLLNNVTLGYEGKTLTSQGLGHKNLIFLLVMLNSLVEKEEDRVYSLLTVEEPEAHLCINNKRLIVSFIKSFMEKNDSIQLFYSTHSTEFINKLDFNNIVVVKEGNAYSLQTELEIEEKNYLSKTPNLDLYKLFYSQRCILVEGLTEELLIRSYISSQYQLSSIDIISFHKGFTKIIDFWIKINKNSNNKLGIIRDFDGEPNAQSEHEKYNENSNVCVRTTRKYTLEDDIVNEGNNYEILKKYFTEEHEWEGLDSIEELINIWKNKKSDTMLQFSQDLLNGNALLKEFVMSKHIQEVIEFLVKRSEGF